MSKEDDRVATQPWDHIQGWDIEAWGEGILDPQQRGHWSAAIRGAAALGYIWKELAPQISEVIYGLLELRQGDRVLIIGEAVEASGWDLDMRAIVGDSGTVEVIEIVREGRAAIASGERGRSGKYGTWKWDYTRDAPADSYDCVAVLQATQHCDDWAETGTDLLRVTKPGRRIVLAEAQLGGPHFWQHANSDVHLRQWVDKLLSSIPIPAEEMPYYSPEDLTAAFAGLVEQPRTIEWRGIEMFWGRKPRA